MIIYERRGFTLIELLVVIAIIGTLASVVLASLSTARAKARDSAKASQMIELKQALELYYADYGQYPSTGSLNTVYGEPGCVGGFSNPDQSTVNWIPGLVAGGYISSLPTDPNAGNDEARNVKNTRACYMYASNGQYFILSAWASVENGPIPENSQLYSRAGFRETSFSNQNYLCNHPNLSNPLYGGDYYRYSYTLTNVNCTW